MTDSPYRYTLTRSTLTGTGAAVFVMLNPSVADEVDDDPTIRRVKGFAFGTLGASRLVVVNLFAYRSTSPFLMWAARRRGVDIVGPGNDDAVRAELAGAAHVVVAWGAVHRQAAPRIEWTVAAIAAAGKHAVALGVTLEGQPRHPLYLPKNAAPCAWPERR